MCSKLALYLLAACCSAATLNVVGFEAGFAIEGTSSGTMSVQTTTKRSGSYALQVNPTTVATGSFSLPKMAAGAQTTYADNTVYVRFYFMWSTKPGTGSEEIFIARQSTSSTYKLSCRLNSDATLGLYSTGGTTLIANGTTALLQNTWYRLDVQVGTGASANYELRINGNTELSGTADQATGSVSTILLGKGINRSSQTINVYYDDVYTSDSGFPPDGKVAIMVPDASGSFSTWTATGAATDWECVDEIPTSGTDYILSPLVSGNATTLNFISATTAGISATSINSVKVTAYAVRDATTNANFRVRLRSGSTNSDTATVTSTATTSMFGLIADTDPATTAAWTTSALNNIEAGAVAQSATAQVRVQVLYIMVDYQPSAAPTSTFKRLLITQNSEAKTWESGS